MHIEQINWREVITITAEKKEISRQEVCRRAGFSGNAALNITNTTRTAEPRYSEGAHILEQYRDATDGAEPIMLRRSERMKCPSCMHTYQTQELFRVSNLTYKCKRCLSEINKANQKRFAKKKNTTNRF